MYIPGLQKGNIYDKMILQLRVGYNERGECNGAGTFVNSAKRDGKTD